MLRVLLTILTAWTATSAHAQQPTRPPGSTLNGIAVPDDVKVRTLSPEELKGFQDSDRYTFVEAGVLEQLLKRRADSRKPTEASVKRSEYSAVLKDESLQSGQLLLELDTSEVSAQDPVSLGRTNLNNLRLFSQDLPLTLATDSNGHLIPLIPPASETITGTWEANSRLVGKTAVFQLTLPASAVALFRLRTDAGVSVDSSNALVVPAEKTERHADWVLYPANPAELTISCVRRDNANGQGELNLAVATRVRVDSFAATVEWEVGIPTVLSEARLTFHVSQPCRIQNVQIGTQNRPEWILETQEQHFSVEVPEIPTASTMIIQAAIDRTSLEEVRVPLLVPDSWRSRFGESGGNTRLKSGRLQLMVSPELTVSSLQLDGLLERDVAYAADGFQTLELSQFSADAAATAFLTPATLVVDESVVVRPAVDDDSGQASAFIYIKAKTGSLGRVHWQVPTTWQVTGVTEMNSNLPLLFLIQESANDADMADVEVFLRTPVTGESGQAIEIRLQSTDRENVVAGAVPEFVNAQYRRQVDLACLRTAQLSSVLSNAESRRLTPLTLETLQNIEPWLTSDDFESYTFFERSELEDTLQLAEDPGLIYDAMLEYSVSENQGTVTESTRLRIRAEQELPQRLNLRVTANSDIRISEASMREPPLRLTKQSTGPVFDIWILEIPADAVADDVDITLIAQRPQQHQMPATMIDVLGTRDSGGSVRPPEGIFELILSNTAPVMQLEPYPDKPFEGSWMLYKSLSTVSRLESSSSAFVMFRPQPDGYAAEILQRVMIGASGTRSTLICRCPTRLTPIVLVNGRRVFADRDGATLQVPVDIEAEQSEIVFLYEFASQLRQDGRWPVPLITFPESQSATSFVFVLPPQKRQLDVNSPTYLRPVDETTELIRSTVDHATQAQSVEALSAFLARWKLAAMDRTDVVSINMSDSKSSLQLRVRNRQFDLTASILWATVVCLAWLFVDRQRPVSVWFPAAVLLTTAALLLTLNNPARSATIVGVAAGTMAFAVYRFQSTIWRSRRVIRTPKVGTAIVRASLLLPFLCCWQAAHGQENRDRPAILIPSTDRQTAPFAYVDNRYLETLKAGQPNSDQECYVVSSVIHVRMESPRSCIAHVSCDVAALPGKAAKLTIPLEGMTLVECRVDGATVFPERNPKGGFHLAISGEEVLPDRPLDSERQSPASAGPDSLGRWEVHSVEYSARTVPRRSPQDYRLTVTYPPSSETIIEFEDASKSVEQITLASVPDAQPLVVNGSVNRFPVVFNTRSVELSLKIRNSGTTDAKSQQRSSLMCVADTLPTQQRLTCEYKVVPTDIRAKKVVIETDPRYRITGVQSVTGGALAWTMAGSSLVVDCPPDASGMQALIVKLLFDPPIGLTHQIPVDVLSQVNGIRTDSTRLIPRTSEQYVINSVMAGDTTLDEAPLTAEPQSFQIVQAGDTVVDVPNAIDVVSIELAELQATRVARLSQKAVIKDNLVQWTCRCEVEVTGQPVFRQALQVSADVRINDVTARSEGVSRLQSWTRHGDQLVVSLPEETQGLLEIVATGTLPRPSGQDLPLPVVLLPPSIQITESDLEVSAESEIDTFIADLGAAVPVDHVDIENTPLTATPISLSVVDDSKPIVVRGNPTKKIAAELVMLLYDADGESRYAQILSLQTPDVPFDIRFRCPESEFGDSAPIMVRNGEAQKCGVSGSHFFIPRVSSTSRDTRVTLALPAVSSTLADDQLVFPIPNFDADIVVTACRAFDLRSREIPLEGAAKIPQWVADAAVYVDVLDDPANADVAECRFDADSRQVTLRPEASVTKTTTISESLDVSFAYGQHLLHFSEGGDVSGQSAFLVFRAQAGGPVTIKIPENCAVADVSVNGTSQAFRNSGETIELSPAGRIAAVEIEWLRRIDREINQTDYAVSVPQLQAAQLSQQAIIVPASSRSRWWKLRNATLSRSAFQAGVLDSLSRGLQLLEVSLAEDAEGSDTNRPLDGMWQAMKAESVGATEAAQLLTRRLQVLLDQGALLVDLEAAEDITITSPTFPSPLVGASLLSAMLLIIAPWWFRVPERTVDDQRTATDQTAITKPTLTSSDILSSTNLNSDSGFSQ